MADVIRNVVVRVKLEQVKADLQAPDMGPVKREIESVKSEVESLNASVRQSSDDIKVSARSSQESFQSFREETNRLGEGMSKLASSVGLYAVAMDDALPPSVRLFSAIRGGVEQMSGLTAIFSQFGGVMAGPVGIAIAGVTTALTLGAVAWQNYAERARRAGEEARNAFKVVPDALSLDEKRSLQDQLFLQLAPDTDRLSSISRRRREEAQQLLKDSRFFATPEGPADLTFQVPGLQKLAEAKSIEEERRAIAKDILQDAQSLADAREREVQAAQRAVDLARGEAASIGALSRGEQNRLRNLAERFGAGEELNRGELIQLQRLGGGIARDAVQSEFASRGQGLAEELRRLLGADDGGAAAAQQRLQEAEQAREKADIAVNAAQQSVDAIERILTSMMRTVERLAEEQDRINAAEF